MWLEWDLNNVQTYNRTAAEFHSKHPALLSLKGMLCSAMYLQALLNELQQVFCKISLHFTEERSSTKLLSAQAKYI